MRPFDALSGTIWVYEDAYMEEMFVVLDGFTHYAPGEHPGTRFRRYVSLTGDGKIEWFAEESHFNYKSKEWG